MQPVEVDGRDGLDAYSVSDEELRQPRAIDQRYACHPLNRVSRVSSRVCIAPMTTRFRNVT